MNAFSRPRRFEPPAPSRAPVVFLPGLFLTRDIWTPLCRDTGIGNRLMLDLPGHVPGEGAAEVVRRLERGDWIDDMARRIAAFADGRPVHLVGHSSGGLVSLLLARHAPRLVRSLVLVGTPMTGHRDRPRDIGAEFMAHDLLGRWSMPIAWRLSLATRARFERSMATVMPRAAAARVPDRLRLRLGACDPEAIRQFGKWVLAQDVTGIMAQIDHPCLAVIGRDDGVVPPHHQVKLLRHLPRAMAQIVPGGHLPFVEHPAHFARTLRGWLALPHGAELLSEPTHDA